MISWKNIDSDIVIKTVSSFLNNFDWANTVKVIGKSIVEPTIFIAKSCKSNMLIHLTSSNKELGGLLLGNAFSIPYKVAHNYPYITIISDAIPSRHFKNSSISLRMETQIWSEIDRYIDSNKIVIGWYHSHPGIGAFFSGTDKMTQKAFFHHAYSLGVVVDPFRDEWECFYGSHSNILESTLVEIEDGLAVA